MKQLPLAAMVKTAFIWWSSISQGMLGYIVIVLTGCVDVS